MSGTTSRPRAAGPATPSTAAGPVTPLTVHGPAGVVDLSVPTDAPVAQVARAYAEEAGLASVLPLVGRDGRPLAPDATVGGSGLVPGAVVAVVDPGAPRRPGEPRSSTAGRPAGLPAGLRPGRLSALWCVVAAGAAALAAWTAATLTAADDRLPVVVVLAAAAGLGCLPVGPLTAQRVVAAPAFGAAACLAAVWDPAPERLPTILGAAGLAAAVVAAVGAALSEESGEALRVWTVVGAGWFATAALAALTSQPPQVVYAVLLLAAVLAARFVPTVAVDVPDQFLIDVERLAVTAWSARERPAGRRGRFVVRRPGVASVAARGARTVTAAAAGVLVVVALTAPLLLWSADLPLDRVGARCLVGFGGCALLLAARSYRHVAARRLLLAAGLWCLASVATVLLGQWGPGARTAVAAAAVGLGFVLVAVAVALGRGWRSAWWSRRAEVAEVVCGSFAVASLVVAVGFFRHLWELTS